MDIESCLGQFDIHRDTIIRTEESQAIGGKFLQGIGLSNLEECQRLCCETEHCDVYIFEEKAEGYCYLFECGPPENFHCKFTRHTNYTSSVLTPIRHSTTPPTTTKSPLPQVPPTPILSKHELELTNLKQKPELNIIQQDKIRTTASSAAVIGAAVINGGSINNNIGVNSVHLVEQFTTKSPQTNASVCGRFQFRCHSGECIAVYNACDGIPQCEDGSDEGSECPHSTGVEIKSLNAEGVNLGNYRVIPGSVAVSLSKQESPQTLPRQYQQQSMQTSIINEPASQIWPNRKGQDSQSLDLERNSRIFNHKGGLQLPVNNIGPQFSNSAPNIYNPVQREMYMQGNIQNGYRSPIIQPQDHIIPASKVNWQQTQIQQQSLIPPGQYVIAVNDQTATQIKSVPVISQQSQLENNNIQIENQPAKNKNTNNIHLTPTESNSLNEKPIFHNSNHKNHIKEKENSEESEDYSYYEERPTEPPKKKQRKHKVFLKEKNKTKEKQEHEKKDEAQTKSTIESPVHEKYKMIKENLEMEFVDHDGQSERPGGAVLSLTLGLIVTAALAILIGCRMRTVSRRIRRIGKAPYAHDADFLVNGMYL